MTNIAEGSEPITVGTYGFNVPCRRFLISANVTRDRRLPVVDEFILRALKVCDTIPIKRLGAYLGITGSELEIVLLDLVARGLIVADVDSVSLHPSTYELFRGTADGNPRIIDIEAWVERLWFDLVSKSMMAPERFRPLPNFIDLKVDEKARELPASFARDAFEKNFAEYLRKIRRISNPDRFGLYSISDVVPERFGSIVVKGREDLIFDPHPRLRPQLMEVEIENLSRYRPLMNAMTDAYRSLTEPEPSATGVTEFSRILDDLSVSEAHSDNNFDLVAWLSANAAKPNKTRQTLIGASYLRRNIDFFIGLLDKQLESNRQLPAAGEVPMIWLRPGGTKWGMTPDLQNSVALLKGAIRRALPEARLRTILVAPQVTRYDNPRRFERIFDQAVIAPPGHLSPTIELLMIGELGAIALVHLALSSFVTVCVGYALVDEAGVKRVREHIGLDTTLSAARALWNRTQQREDEEVFVGSVMIDGEEAS